MSERIPRTWTTRRTYENNKLHFHKVGSKRVIEKRLSNAVSQQRIRNMKYWLERRKNAQWNLNLIVSGYCSTVDCHLNISRVAICECNVNSSLRNSIRRCENNVSVDICIKVNSKWATHWLSKRGFHFRHISRRNSFFTWPNCSRIYAFLSCCLPSSLKFLHICLTN